jgi:hypothetical protein
VQEPTGSVGIVAPSLGENVFKFLEVQETRKDPNYIHLDQRVIHEIRNDMEYGPSVMATHRNQHVVRDWNWKPVKVIQRRGQKGLHPMYDGVHSICVNVIINIQMLCQRQTKDLEWMHPCWTDNFATYRHNGILEREIYR